ncbi:YdcF family protein [Tamlana sp. 2201CG12-4]|uniref:YdcF family protein n=1 Tax=Tamlana sp. 2201CG12-4 TaxID=3112582 RepID=UPI002DB575E9|nr:YdcF family protein [Tamlana sp. 2201CG12-4]MEC3908704.1 YdcF family protein [Tamlana sp. 2201CG12-4]
MANRILIALGAPNSPSGILSEISISRLDYVLKQYSKGTKVLCTGGWGQHFNIAANSHAFYAKQYLIKKGVREEDFLEPALSQNTVDDAVKIKPIISGALNPKLTIITSDYHLERVTLIFKDILKGHTIGFVGVSSHLDKKTRDSLVKHEQKAIRAILKNGLYY